MLRLIVSILGIAIALSGAAQSGYVDDWNPDADGDGNVGVSDLLALLSVFSENDVDGDGIWDSVDDCLGVYDACGVCNGAGEDDDEDGLCDDVDDCVGAYDECGVCNGAGPDIPVIDEILYETDSVFIEVLGEWYVFEYAIDTLFTYVCPVSGCTDETASNYDPEAVIEDGSCAYGPLECGGVSTVTFDGYTYDLVAIGDQCWFVENLRTEHYANGDAIPGELSDGEWSNTTSGAVTVYGEGTSTVYNGSEDEVSNLADYGRLYNWYAVDDARGLCPSGWHVPTDEEFMTLEMELGMSESEANGTGWRGTDQGTQMKTTFGWNYDGNGSNSSGFAGKPGGFRHYLGNFANEGRSLSMWSSVPLGDEGITRELYYDEEQVLLDLNPHRMGLSVRCVRDSESLALSGCTDETASNYDPEAVIEDGSCVYGPLECGGASTVTFDGYTYDLVAIGDQCWFAENLRAENYTNGDAIPANLSDSEWSSTTSGAVSVYGEDANCDDYSPDGDACDPSWSLNEYGRLYNWYGVDDARGLCPTGWHVPTDEEWMTLEMELGMSESDANSTGWRGTDQGTQMKTTYGWYGGGNGTNSSGFSGLPGGFRNTYGTFSNAGNDGYWWSSSPSGSSAWVRHLFNGIPSVYRGSSDQRFGFSVRCLKDAE